MARNPFITRSEWQTTKAKYFIPDKIVSGSFGEKMQKLYDKFEKEGLKNLTKPKVPIAMALVQEGRKVFDDWLSKAAKVKPESFNNKEKKDGQKNKDGAINRVKYFRGCLQDLENNASVTKDFFAGSRANYNKCLDLMKTAMASPDSAKALQELYSQGIRNHIGAQFHAALTQYAGTEEVMKELNKYEQLAGKWNHLQGSGTADLANDPVKRVEFLKDMQDAMRIGVRILGLTK
jgi:hypothetical protein